MSPESQALQTDAAETPTEVVQRFYAAVTGGHPEAVEEIVDDHFAEDATVTWPDSLPYGGTVEGARRLRRALAAAAQGGAPAGPRGLELVRVVGDAHDVAAEVRFEYVVPGSGDVVASGAIEWWHFEAGKLVELKAFYLDTAAVTGRG